MLTGPYVGPIVTQRRPLGSNGRAGPGRQAQPAIQEPVVGLAVHPHHAFGRIRIFRKTRYSQQVGIALAGLEPVTLEVVVAHVDDVNVSQQGVGKHLARPACLVTDEGTLGTRCLDEGYVGPAPIGRQGQRFAQADQVDGAPRVLHLGIEYRRGYLFAVAPQGLLPNAVCGRLKPRPVPPRQRRAEVKVLGRKHGSQVVGLNVDVILTTRISQPAHIDPSLQ